ncbi:protease B nonderepressible form [Elasticomyces elasticus]|nr:protease B nonderepressible form [Elasticomyces elasticus]KAK4931496.1 protease B nonderepressible form [Elasticomyces elasticus]
MAATSPLIQYGTDEMKQRITYLLPEGTDYDPANIHIGPDSVNITNTAEPPAIEKRVTAGLSELPAETWLAKTFCPGTFRGECPNEIATLSFASYIDVDFDAISHAVTFTAVWRAGIGNPGARTPARLWGGQEGGGLEVGVLVPQTADEAEEVKLGGFLVVVGEDEHPRLHPKMSITFPRHELTPPKSDGACALHAYLTLPSAVFLDRHQLSDPAVLKENGLVALRSLSGEQDLEAPDWILSRWGSAALIELAPTTPSPSSSDGAGSEEGDWTATIPLHLRYLQAAGNTTAGSDGGSAAGNRGGEGEGYVNLTVPYPAVFWACEAEEGLKMSTNPFDRVDIGYDGLFGPKTMFLHVPPATGGSSVGGSSVGGVGGVGVGSGVLESVIRVPVLEPSWGGVVQWGTLGAVVGGLGWVCWGLVRGMGGTGKKGGKKSGVVGKTE